MKTCIVCGCAKPLEAFHRTATSTDGRRNDCAACKNAKSRQKYSTDAATRERVITAAAAYRSAQVASGARQEWLDRTREQRRAKKAAARRAAGSLTRKQWAEQKAARDAQAAIDRAARKPHSAHVTAWKKARQGAYFVHRYRTDAEFNAKQKLRARLRQTRFKDHDLSRLMAVNLKSGVFGKGWAELLGYTAADLVAHLKRTLPKGAKWEQFLSGELHIDHITPRAAFDLTDLDEVRACWSLGNLRLLKAKDNLRKKDRIEVLL